MTYKHELENGFIEYRLPKADEALILLGEIGMTSNPEQINEYVLMGKLIKKIEPFILKVEVKNGDLVITDYKTLLEDLSFVAPICTLARKMLEALSGVSEDKKKL
jgi:hypothetical protein